MQASAAKLHVLHTESSRNWGGQEYRILDQIRWLLGHGHEAALAAPEDSEILARARREGLPAHAVNFRGSYSPTAIAHLRRLIRRGRFDVVDVHGAHDATTGGCARDISCIVRSLHVYTPQKNSGLRRLSWRWLCHHAIATAECIKRQLVMLRFKSAERISVVGEWAGAEFFDDRRTAQARSDVRRELGLASDSVLFAVIGMLRPDKGQIHFIRAAAHYLKSHRDAYFLIVGSATRQHGAYEQALRETAHQLGVGQRVLFTGYREDVARIMRATDAVVITSTTVEAQSRVAPQAFACGIPVLAGRVGGVPELVVHQETGWLVDVGDDVGFAKGLSTIISDRGETDRIVKNARHLAEHRLTIDCKMRETITAYERARLRGGPSVRAAATA
ncbi:MAG: glycosyltransferase family 4 protein [Nitrospirota bacterium]